MNLGTSWVTSRLRPNGRRCPGLASSGSGNREVDCLGQGDKADHKSLGFTLIELMIVTSIIGILATISLYLYFHRVNDAKTVRSISEIKEISFDISLYEMDHLAYPNDLDDVGHGNRLDPWGNPYQYVNIEDNPGQGRTSTSGEVNTDYDLYTKGIDGQSNQSLDDNLSKDDIIRADDGEFLGPASKY